MTTTVVNLTTDKYDVYIGRKNWYKGLPATIWANPFSLHDHTRDEALMLYEQYLKDVYRRAPGAIDNALDQLRGKRLGCWCKPEACHGDLVARLADMTDDQRKAWATDAQSSVSSSHRAIAE